MKFIQYIIFIALILVAFPQTARAEFEDGDLVPEAIVAPLMAWVEMQTGVRVPVLPQVIASHTTLSNVVSGMGGFRVALVLSMCAGPLFWIIVILTLKTQRK